MALGESRPDQMNWRMVAKPVAEAVGRQAP